MPEDLLEQNLKKLDEYKRFGYKNVLAVILFDERTFENSDRYPDKMSLSEAESLIRDVSDAGLSFVAVK